MKKIIILLVLAVALITACKKDNIHSAQLSIEGLTKENYPKIDGSTSTLPLQQIIACKLLHMRYEWMQALHYDGTYFITAADGQDTDKFLGKNIVHHGTHQAYINLIDNKADLILVARLPSADELAHADTKNIHFTITPIALDAFTFIVNPENPVKILTTKQIQDIYTGKITNWKEVGGNDAPIKPYKRNTNSGSQELMESLVMKGLTMNNFPVEVIGGMMGAFSSVGNDRNALCYTVYYYKEVMVRGNIVKHISVDGVYPDKNTIRRKEYPFTTEVYAVVREDVDKNSPAYKLYQALLTKNGQEVIAESGYIQIK